MADPRIVSRAGKIESERAISGLRRVTGSSQIFNQVGIQTSPAVAGGTVYFGCRDSHPYAVDARTGQ